MKVPYNDLEGDDDVLDVSFWLVVSYNLAQAVNTLRRKLRRRPVIQTLNLVYVKPMYMVDYLQAAMESHSRMLRISLYIDGRGTPK